MKKKHFALVELLTLLVLLALFAGMVAPACHKLPSNTNSTEVRSKHAEKSVKTTRTAKIRMPDGSIVEKEVSRIEQWSDNVVEVHCTDGSVYTTSFENVCIIKK